jgi:hypothetical protein
MSRVVPCGQSDRRRHMTKSPEIDSKPANTNNYSTIQLPTVASQLAGVRLVSKQQQWVPLTTNVPKGIAVYLSLTYFLITAPKGCCT